HDFLYGHSDICAPGKHGDAFIRCLYGHGRTVTNLLRKWIKLHQQRLSEDSTQSSTAESAFVPVVMVSSEQALVEHNSVRSSSLAATASSPANAAAASTLTAQMPNGITLKLECGKNDAALLSVMIETLGRCDVPAKR
ncbi:hypothetical protein, partial [Paraburkholderia graminis]|uniref:hypothetical protein n=1 Tax=Paraburkholderia graminis TaxID=60548 RepID=UPI00286D54D7